MNLRHMPAGSLNRCIPWIANLLMVVAFHTHLPLLHAQSESPHSSVRVPQTGDRMAMKADDCGLTDLELMLHSEFDRNKPLTEVFSLISAKPFQIHLPILGEPVGAVVIRIYVDSAEMRWYLGDTPERYFHRQLSSSEVDRFRKEIDELEADRLSNLSATRVDDGGGITSIVGGVEHVYAHLAPNTNVRTLLNNPGDEGPATRVERRYFQLVELFERFKDARLCTMVYDLPRPVPGLEVLLADAKTNVLGVWMEHGRLCVSIEDNTGRDGSVQHRYFENGRLGDAVRARRDCGADIATFEGLKVSPVRSSCDGRWILGNRIDDGELVCFDNRDKKMIPICDKRAREKAFPLYYLSDSGEFLIAELNPAEFARCLGDTSPSGGHFRLRRFNPLSGAVVSLNSLASLEDNVIGDAEMWLQDLPCELQPVRSSPEVKWMASPKYGSTTIGQVDGRRLIWLNREDIAFFDIRARSMWIDEDSEKLLFVYKGHLLRLNLPSSLFKVTATERK